MENHATFTFGRFNPPTTGHKKLVDAVVNHAKKTGGKHYVFLSHTQDSKKNPLSHEQKVHFAKKMFPHANVVDHSEHKTVIHAMKHLEKQGHTHVHMVVGSDRVEHMRKLLHQYNGKEYNFKHIEVHSAGHRDPDAEGEEGMSASKQREHAKSGNFSEFRKGVPVKKHAKELYHAVRKSMKVEYMIPHFKALFLVGGPGSGKDFLIHSVLDECNLQEVSLDKLHKAITEESNIPEMESFPSIIVNGNADNIQKISECKITLEAMGYDVAMLYVHTNDQESKIRNDYRISRGSKTFSEGVRKQKYDICVANMHQYSEMFESFIIYDNSNNFATVNEEMKMEITGWLVEMAETIFGFLVKLPSNEASLKWLHERVMEVGTDGTVLMHRAITPGQLGNKARSYKDADKYVGGVKSANVNSPTRTTVEGIQARPPSSYSDAKSYSIGSTGVASVPSYEDGKKTKIKKVPTTPGAAAMFNSNLGAVPQTFGLSAYSEQFKKKIKG